MHGKKRVLIVGGYGMVGKAISEILSKDEKISLTISGRNSFKAKNLAEKLGTHWITVDIADKQSISSALVNTDIVINCFSGPFTHSPLTLPELALKRGIHYLDVAGSYEYAERFLKLNAQAVENKTILITALGANPGIPGIVLMSIKDEFDKIDSCKIYFIMGSSFEEISVSSLKELKYMFDVEPLVWEQSQWSKPSTKSIKEYVGKPFEKEIYMGLSLTRDLLVIPKLVQTNHISFWSGAQNTLQGLILLTGLKIGMTKNNNLAHLLLKLLKNAGNGKNAVADSLLKVEVTGEKEGIKNTKIFEMYCEEIYATAIAPSIVCQQIIEEKITKFGAFVPPEIVPAKEFVDRLKTFEIHFSF